MKPQFKPIAMRCTEEQFNELKPRLDEYGLEVKDNDFDLEVYKYITNFYDGENNRLGSTFFKIMGREIIKTFDADLFLNCCGIETEPTYKLTKEQIIENKDLTLKEMFKEVFETELEVGKWYSFPNGIALLNEINTRNNKGFFNDKWVEDINFIPSYVTGLATEEEVKTALVNEAIKRGFKEGVNIKNEHQGRCTLNKLDLVYSTKYNNGIYCRNSSHAGFWLFINGVWSDIIEQKEMTVAEIEKELGYNIKIVK